MEYSPIKVSFPFSSEGGHDTLIEEFLDHEALLELGGLMPVFLEFPMDATEQLVFRENYFTRP